MSDRIAEYEICKVRGHTSSGHGYTPGIGPTRTVCTFCGTGYYFTEPQLVEENTPEADTDEGEGT